VNLETCSRPTWGASKVRVTHSDLHKSTNLYTYIRVHKSTNLYTYISYTHVYVNKFAYLDIFYIYLSRCVSASIFLCLHICMYVYICNVAYKYASVHTCIVCLWVCKLVTVCVHSCASKTASTPDPPTSDGCETRGYCLYES